MESKEEKTEVKTETTKTETMPAASAPAKNNALMYLVVFIIVALLVGGGAYYFMNKDDKDSDDSEESSDRNDNDDEEEDDEDSDVEDEDDNDDEDSADNEPRGERTAALTQTPEEYADEFENLSDSELVLTMQFLGFDDVDEDEAQDIAEELIDIYEEYYDGDISDIEYLNKFSEIYTSRGATFFGAGEDGSSNLDDLQDYEDLYNLGD